MAGSSFGANWFENYSNSYDVSRYNIPVTLHQPYIVLRQKHPQFFYHQSNWQIVGGELHCSWVFELEPDLIFKPKLSIPLPEAWQLHDFDQAIIDQLVFNIGMVESLSYWKLAASPKIVVKAGSLSEEQVRWWHELLLSGMGEYFYLNEIDFTQEKFVEIVGGEINEKDAAAATVVSKKSLNPNAYLIPIGGGKDSIVTLELLKLYQSQNPDIQLLASSLNPTQASLDVIKQSGLSFVNVTRQLDPQLLALNQQGYLNGHTPFSALLAFANSLVAYLYNYQHVVLSNEQSANEGNVQFHGQTINHQYSKSYAFERNFRQYIKNIAPVNYFSLLRPFSELQIAGAFAKLGENYFSLFRSCNRGQKTNSWCGECAKCLFAWIVLFPFLGEEKMTKIFGQNLFEKLELLPTSLDLIGQTANKPFDCVGTYAESKTAFVLAIKWYQQKNLKLPKLLEKLEKSLRGGVILNSIQKPPAQISTHFIPTHLTYLLHPYV